MKRARARSRRIRRRERTMHRRADPSEGTGSRARRSSPEQHSEKATLNDRGDQADDEERRAVLRRERGHLNPRAIAFTLDTGSKDYGDARPRPSFGAVRSRMRRVYEARCAPGCRRDRVTPSRSTRADRGRTAGDVPHPRERRRRFDRHRRTARRRTTRRRRSARERRSTEQGPWASTQRGMAE
jgi:hypothetical protein